MASLTIRKLDEGVKTYLRLRSAKNRRSSVPSWDEIMLGNSRNSD